MGASRSSSSQSHHHFLLLPLQFLLLLHSVFSILCLFFLFMQIATAQVTDPEEVKALNTIFQMWDIYQSFVWTTTGDPCAGSMPFDISYFDQWDDLTIACDCTNRTSYGTCHVTGLAVYGWWDRIITIPQELQVFKRLKGLNLASNRLNGSLPAFLGNLTGLQYLNLQDNDLLGSIPKELGNLKNLLILNISANNFNGTIPHELGGMISLQELWLSDNDFTGAVPDFFGSFTNMTKLWIRGNSFQGPIPTSFSKLTKMTNLSLAANYLTGPLPTFFGNLIDMQYLDLGDNALSGPIPKELGNLKNLYYLSIGANNFSGTIPPELGGMITLHELYMDSSGLSGDLPFELSNLKSFTTLWLSDNDFTGVVPDFFGSFTNMTELRMQGNSFQGPIPVSFSNLTKMIDLRIGDIINGSSTLHFISNMHLLESLILRNCKIFDALPSDFSQYGSLTYLDMSFNNITGSISQSLFSLNKLESVFLGNNSLSGSLPAQKSLWLTSVDVSYNQLAGTLPQWAKDSISRNTLNLVANNFALHKSDIRAFPAGLDCLQNNKPCYRDAPIHSSFAINCAGSTFTASDRITYEDDDADMTGASYNVANSFKWAISSVGTVLPSTYTDELIAKRQFNRTLDPELLKTSRRSTSSLRYYGLGLENGRYAVKLQFAETQFIDGPTWKSVGRRLFDIYIQGDLKEKDFDIRKEAGGSSFTAVVKEYTASVTNNFLEIHFFWAGKGTCCVPYQGYYGPSISAISVARKGSSSTTLAVGLVAGAVVILLVTLCLILRHFKRKALSKEEIERELHTIFTNVNLDNFSYKEMRIATGHFSSSNRLGEGGYGPVFKGKLPDGRIVAVKQLSKTSHQGMHQFFTEIATISAVQHRNLVKLLGYCVKGEKRILAYEFLENGSLDQAIFGKSKYHLDWPKRFGICLGVARGLAYLHEESPVQIVHRDIKASNILLDADYNPKISDFGLAKLYDEKKTHVSTKIAGTIGYLAPEYALRGHLTKKADVYAFGVLCLEILAGRPNSDRKQETEKIYLLEWAWFLHESNCGLELVDGSLSSFNPDEVGRVIRVALLCTQASPAQRPLMSKVVAMLAGDIEVSAVTMRPSYLDYTTTSSQVIAEGQGTAMSTPSEARSLMNSFLIEGR